MVPKSYKYKILKGGKKISKILHSFYSHVLMQQEVYQYKRSMER